MWLVLIIIISLIVLGKISEQQEINELALKLGNNVFVKDEGFNNLSAKEQIDFCNELWEKVKDKCLERYGTKTEAIYNKFLEYVSEGRFSIK
ncbi:hypothetical protein IJI31_00120 [bacterium]|nr:hypothetical protein [bacterium]